MRKIIFLDFDGVLHSESCLCTLTKLGIFEAYLTRMPEAEVVISSSWRELFPFAELRELFSPVLQKQIIGKTPILPNGYGYEHSGRQQEIEEFLSHNDLDNNNASWVALDDIQEFFYKDCPYLILVDPTVGFSDKEGKALLTWYHSSSGAVK